MHQKNVDRSLPRARLIIFGCAWLVVGAGCGGGGESTGPVVGTPPAAAAICPGFDPGTAAKLVYVSPQGGPFFCTDPTFACNIEAATERYKNERVTYLLRHGLYSPTETLTIQGGSQVYGSCRFSGEPDLKYRTVIQQAGAAPGVPTIRIEGNLSSTLVSGVVVLGQDQPSGGFASIAMTVANASVALSRTVLVAGQGGAGAARPTVLSATAAPSAQDHCYTPGGAANDSLWGQVDPGTFYWAPGIGGAGAGGVYDTGPGGVGGQQGGASIALLLVNSSATGVANEYNHFAAGLGGVGGAGQAGPSFGLGGGANSGGAGGNGGPSIGIASIGTSTSPDSDTFFYGGTPGAGGEPGAAGVDQGQCSGDPGARGLPGGAAAAYRFQIPNTLASGHSLAEFQSLYSPNLQYQLVLQEDSNLCLVSAGRALWCSQTNGDGVYQAIMQSDGNMCVYGTQGDFSFFCSGSAGHPGAYLTVTNSGHAQVVDVSGAVLWSVP